MLPWPQLHDWTQSKTPWLHPCRAVLTEVVHLVVLERLTTRNAAVLRQAVEEVKVGLRACSDRISATGDLLGRHETAREFVEDFARRFGLSEYADATDERSVCVEDLAHSLALLTDKQSPTRNRLMKLLKDSDGDINPTDILNMVGAPHPADRCGDVDLDAMASVFEAALRAKRKQEHTCRWLWLLACGMTPREVAELELRDHNRTVPANTITQARSLARRCPPMTDEDLQAVLVAGRGCVA